MKNVTKGVIYIRFVLTNLELIKEMSALFPVSSPYMISIQPYN